MFYILKINPGQSISISHMQAIHFHISNALGYYTHWGLIFMALGNPGFLRSGNL